MKRNPKGSGYVEQKKGCKTWTITFYKDGKRHRESLGVKVKTKSEARKELRDRIGQVDRNEYVEHPKKPVTVQELFKYSEEYVKLHRPEGAGELRRRLNHLEPELGNILAGFLSTDMISAYALKRRVDGKAKNATINREFAALKRAYNLARRCTPPKVRSVPYIPMLDESDNVRTGFLESKQHDTLADATLSCVGGGLWLRTMFEIGYVYGWRKGELLNLKVSNVDLKGRTITLDPGSTKNGEGREVSMNPTIHGLLAACIEGRGPEDNVFRRMVTLRGGKQEERPVTDIRPGWPNACAMAGVPDLLFHDLRRTAVRNLIRAGVSEKVAMQITGHKTRSMLDRYDIVNQNDIREALEKLERQSKLDQISVSPDNHELSPDQKAQTKEVNVQ